MQKWKSLSQKLKVERVESALVLHFQQLVNPVLPIWYLIIMFAFFLVSNYVPCELRNTTRNKTIIADTVNDSNTDDSFTMAKSKSFFSP